MTGPVLLCYDGSDDAKHAISEAGRLLGPRPALAVHIWEPLSAVFLWNPLLGSPGPLAEPAEEIDAAGAETAGELASEGAEVARAAGFEAEPLAVKSTEGVWPMVVRLAEEREAAAVVMGERGRSGVSSALVGSVTSGVVHHCTRPVVVIPWRERRTARRL